MRPHPAPRHAAAGIVVWTMVRTVSLAIALISAVAPAVTPAAMPAAIEEAPPGAASAPDAARAASALARRVLGDRAAAFSFEAIPPERAPDGAALDVFEIEARDGRPLIRGSDGVAMAAGLHWYLKYRCLASVSWAGDQLELPRPLPDAPRTRVASPHRHRYQFNYCTFSYSMAWWDWARWEREIDWMALQGIDMPLAVTGQEAIWRKVYRDLGLTDAEIGAFFVGPAYLIFGWMGCMDGWGGPLPDRWIESHLDLAKRIVARERELGMTPVLQGFTGHVPQALRRVFPDARLRETSSWCGFPPTSFLDPEDPLFVRIGKAFLDEQARELGTDHLYAADTFIEMSPPSGDPAFLDRMGKAIHAAMTASDPDAVWVLQGWIFVNNPGFWKPPQARAFLGSVPRDRMLLLDLFCDVNPAWRLTEAFHGKPWVWCVIHNFGATPGMFGDLGGIASALSSARGSPDRGRLVGTGMMMEGIEQNPIFYDFMAELGWRDAAPDVDAWVRDWARRRYGRPHEGAEAAWATLRRTVYASPAAPRSAICSRPSLSPAAVCGRGGAPYRTVDLLPAWEGLLAAADDLGRLDTFRYDLVDVSRQVLSEVAEPLYLEARAAWRAKDRARLRAEAGRFLGLIRDLDGLLATRREVLLGRWIQEARRWGEADTAEDTGAGTAESATGDTRRATGAQADREARRGTDPEARRAEADHYEWNARNLITLWGPRRSVLHEYARKEWSGLLEGFYLPRWELFFRRMDEALADASLAGGREFDAGAFEEEITAWEEAWTHGKERYCAEPRGDSVAISRALLARYRPILEEALRPDAPSLTTGKPASASSALRGHEASLACDGFASDTDRYWATDVGMDPDPWWQVDLQRPTRVDRVVVVGYYGDRRSYGFVVETSLDGKAWETAADLRENAEPSSEEGIECRFPAREVRYLRVRQTRNSANTGRHLVEVMAYAQ